jgi:hypothetical protein
VPAPRRAGGSHHRPTGRTARRTWVALAATLAAAGATTGMIIWKPWAPKPGCNVDFYIHPQFSPGLDRGFEARVTVANIGNRTLDPWQLVFVFRGGQQVDRVEGAGAYEPGIGGQKVTGQSPLLPGKAITFGVWGHGGTQMKPPSDFVLNDTACDLRVDMRGPDDPLPAIKENVDAPVEKSRPPTGQPQGPPPGGNGDPNNPGGRPQPTGGDPNNPGGPGPSPTAFIQATPPAQRTRRAQGSPGRRIPRPRRPA